MLNDLLIAGLLGFAFAIRGSDFRRVCWPNSVHFGLAMDRSVFHDLHCV